MTPRPVRLLFNVSSAVILLAIVSGCGGKESTNPTQTASALIRVSGNGQSGTVGEVLPNALVVKVVDAAGAGVPDVAVEWLVSSGAGGVNANRTTTDQSGQTLVTLTLGPAPGTNTVSASVAQLAPVTFTATAIGPPAKLSYGVQPTSVTAGAPIVQAVQVVVQDAQGNIAPTATSSVTLAITPGTGTTGATLGGTLTQTAVSGVATFSNLTIDKAGNSYALTATASGLTSVVSTTFTVSVGPAARLAFALQPSDVTAGAAIAPAVQVVVQDAQGNTVPTATNSVTLAITPSTGAPGATLGGMLTQTGVSGVATFSNLAISKAGTGYTLTATASGLTSVVSTTFAVNVGPAAKLAFVVQPSNVTAGAAIAPAVQVVVQDAQGNTVPTATNSVTLGITGGTAGATLSGTLTRVLVGGVATFSDLTIDKAGLNYALAVSASGLTSDVSTRFNVNAGAAAKLAFVVQPHDLMARAVIAPALQVVVQDALGNTVTSSTIGVTVAITSGTGAAGAALSGTATQAANAGVASFGDLSIDSAGTGYTLTATSSGLTGAASVPFRVIGPLVATMVSAASYVFSCALVSGGAAYCWGYNGNGQLGDGTTTFSNAPVAVSGGLTFASISAGGLHTCGVTTGGAAYCWGLGSYGELGNGAYSESHTPVPVSGGLTFTTVSAGVYHTCGVTTSGAAYCWGDNGGGDLGDSSYSSSNTPVAVAGGLVFTAVSAGYEHSCGVTTGGAAYCWGSGEDGDLGIGSLASSNAPVSVSGGLTFAAVSAEADPTSCGLTTGGAAYCWGWNAYGQLGDGSTSTLSTSPVPVSGGLTFTAISAGDVQACGLTGSGAAYCWGGNVFGELGDGTTTNRHTPVAVSGGLTFTAVSSGRQHTCGLATSGIAYCWGANVQGELGNRSNVDSSVPVRVSGP
jgi:alpha-tubulin suppressor-like RCC1 family protein